MECVVGIVFLLSGLAALIGAVCLIRSNIHKQRDWRKTTGVVIGHQQSFRNNEMCYRPEVQFTDDSGKPHVFADALASNTRINKIGDSLAVIYHPDAPEKAAINSFLNLHASSVVITFLAASFLGLGCYMIFK